MSQPATRLRILHVLTLWSESGEYGGPCTVAKNLANGMIDLGHDVTIVAGTRREATRRDSDSHKFKLRRFPVSQALPRTGFAGLVSPSMLAWLRQNWSRFDVAHIHLARDLVTIPAAYFLSRKELAVICQTHGMIDPSSRLLARPLDAVFTRPIFARASAVLALTDEESKDLQEVGASVGKIQNLPNGVPIPQFSEAPSPSHLKPIIAFISRLHPRKNATVFASAAENLIREGFDGTFVIAGHDEGDGIALSAIVRRVNNPDKLSWIGPINSSEVTALLQKSAFLVLPSVNEPYPMIVLEALAQGRPVLISESCGLAAMIRENCSGVVCEASTTSVTRSIRTMLSNRRELERMGENARVAIERFGSLQAIARRAEEIYQGALDTQGSGPSRPRPKVDWKQ